MPFGWAAGAAVAGSAISAGAGLIGASKQASAVKDASNQQNALLEQQRGDLAPWRSTGTTANTAAADILGLNGQDAATTAFGNFHQSPGYQFSMDEGLRAVDAGAAAKGLLRSGATLKAEQAYGTGLADQEFGNYYQRIMGLSQQGVGAATGNASTTNTGIAGAANTGAQDSSIYGGTATGLSNNVNSLLNNKAVQGWLGGSGGGSANYDPGQWGYTAGGAGTNTLQSLGFFNPLMG